jgi:hypothetical protein
LPQAVRPASNANVSANVGAKCDTRIVIFSQISALISSRH